ncbi:nucleotidyl transferase AbiEii/AbiGii toxin family protein [bacterium]|nr:nucleotidyl transferase AbiEii/AbiGii toxin family protein [bacterium]
MRHLIKNIAASNRAKLLNLSRESGQSFQELVQYFAMGRFLYRLSVSRFSDQFLLKGAMLLHALEVKHARATLDIDLLGWKVTSPESIGKIINSVIKQNVDPDGLEFMPESIDIFDITKTSGYIGCRVKFTGTLGSILIPMQIDIGFGDSIIPDPIQINTPVMLGYPSGKLQGYALETSIAEKIHAIFQLEILNSRMKDFYDIWFLSRNVQINKELLSKSIAGTFMNRGTVIAKDSIVFTDKFRLNNDKQKQWSAFCRKRNIKNVPDKFHEIADEVMNFIKPLL